MPRLRRIPTETEVAKICHLLEKGWTLDLAARSCGVSVHSVRRWDRDGQAMLASIDADVAAGLPAPDHETMPELARVALAFERARAVGLGRALDAVYTAACEGFAAGDSIKPPDWRAAAWVLERTAPDDFRERQQVDHGVAQGDDETAEAIAERLVKAREQRRKAEAEADAD